MMASIPAYNNYANRVLMPSMDQQALAEVKKLDGILRMPADQWPDP
jgi:proline iminopeptidase